MKLIKMVGMTGLEPATSWSRTRRSSQTEPHPDLLHYMFFKMKFTNLYLSLYNNFQKNQSKKGNKIEAYKKKILPGRRDRYLI